MANKTMKDPIRYTDEKGNQYGISKRELGLKASKGEKDAETALKRMKNHNFIYPDKILREKKSIGGVIKGKPKLAKKGWK